MSLPSLEEILSKMRDLAIESLKVDADLIAEEARERAPVQKMGKYGGRLGGYRKLTKNERKVFLEASKSIGRLAEAKAVLRANPYANKPLMRGGKAISGSRGGEDKKYFENLAARDANARNARFKYELESARGGNDKRSGFFFHTESQQLLSRNEAQRISKNRPENVRFSVGGKLRSSIHVAPIENGWEVDVPVRYAMYVEFPTRHNRAQPFLLPAFMQYRKGVVQRVGGYMKNRLSKISGGSQ